MVFGVGRGGGSTYCVSINSDPWIGLSVCLCVCVCVCVCVWFRVLFLCFLFLLFFFNPLLPIMFPFHLHVLWQTVCAPAQAQAYHYYYFNAKDGFLLALSLSLPTADISAVRGSSHYSWASWSRGFVYFLANGVCLAECSKQFFNKFWVVFQADFCVLWMKSCSVGQDGVQKVYCWRSSQNFVRIAEQRRH